MNRVYFGTDGVRGLVGGPLINPEFAARLGEAAARWALSANLALHDGAPRRVLIGRDTRASGPALVEALASGLAAGGLAPVSLGIVPTPAVSQAVRTHGAALGAVVTASHNPASDNGIKFFGPSGIKLDDTQESAIEALIPSSASAKPSAPLPTLEVAGDYVRAALQLLPAARLTGWRIVVDTSNGATCSTTPVVLRALGAEVVSIGASPDGSNINAGVGSEHPGVIANTVIAERAVLGIAHDGDGDRCILCDERGGPLDGDELLAILAVHALRAGRLAGNTLVATIQSNLGLDRAVRAAGGRVLRTPVGDRYVIQRMLSEGARLGGETSGHVICADFTPSGDGLVAALRVIQAMLETGQPLSELRKVISKLPQRTGALRVREKRPLADLTELRRVVERIEREFGEDGRLLVRYSGTEPKLRLLVEGPDEGSVSDAYLRLESAARAELEVL
ncbi:phosphoglucosamine mutase [mine drainage metagenome]|uniref:Phosphoglucosamine mutase n=1 Tax=mine drainage metagenome TaxID=410659 RepID=A0A1J5TBC7_9ZZZZ